jgi:hypothetical protein
MLPVHGLRDREDPGVDPGEVDPVAGGAVAFAGTRSVDMAGDGAVPPVDFFRQRGGDPFHLIGREDSEAVRRDEERRTDMGMGEILVAEFPGP